MLSLSNDIVNDISAPVRKVLAKVELYKDSTLVDTYNYNGDLVSFEIERIGDESRFFGFTVCQKINVKLRDVNREKRITTANSFRVYITVGNGSFIKIAPVFYVSEVHRDENTNQLSITAYDKLYKATKHNVSEIGVNPYTIKEFAEACADYIGTNGAVCGKNQIKLNVAYTPTGVTTDIDGDTITATATEADTYIGIHLATMKLKKNTTYTVSGNIFPQNNNGSYISIRHSTDGTAFDYHGNSSTVSTNTDTYVKYTFDTGDYEYFRVALFITDNVSKTGSTIFRNLQLEENSVATDYLRYIEAFDIYYENGANFDGAETIREALDMIAEATQTIAYIDTDDYLVFKRLDMSGNPVLNIDKAKYFTLDSKTNRRLATITHATELGDNISASITESGTTQYIRNNPFWEMREDIAQLVDNALSAIGGLTINQFTCSWRGDFRLELGDKIGLTTKDNNTVVSYVLNDSIKYDGSFSQKTEWNYSESEGETATNPTSIGEAIKQTYAKVDKVNKQIEIVASEAYANSEKIASLEINTESINATVSGLQESTNSTLESINGNMEELTKKVEASITAEDVNLAIKTELSNGVDKVVTSTGFTFNEEGLTVSKSGTEMATTITEDGMTVKRDDTAVLTANHTGVDAVNLRAATYLIIGKNSRFEDYGKNRTGCFWIGG